jgi:hypothetical protein
LVTKKLPTRKAKPKPAFETAAAATAPPPAPSICACGEADPQYKGYCENCVRRICREYTKTREWFLPLEEQHDQLEDKLRAISAKKILLKRKIESLEQRAANPIDVEENAVLQELKLQIATLENEIYAMEKETDEQLDLIQSKHGSIEDKLAKVDDKRQFLGD